MCDNTSGLQIFAVPPPNVRPPLPPKGEVSVPVPPPRRKSKSVLASPFPNRKDHQQVRSCVIS